MIGKGCCVADYRGLLPPQLIEGVTHVSTLFLGSIADVARLVALRHIGPHMVGKAPAGDTRAPSSPPTTAGLVGQGT